MLSTSSRNTPTEQSEDSFGCVRVGLAIVVLMHPGGDEARCPSDKELRTPALVCTITRATFWTNILPKVIVAQHLQMCLDAIPPSSLSDLIQAQHQHQSDLVTSQNQEGLRGSLHHQRVRYVGIRLPARVGSREFPSFAHWYWTETARSPW